MKPRTKPEVHCNDHRHACIAKFRHAVPEIFSRTDRQTNTLITILRRCSPEGEGRCNTIAGWLQMAWFSRRCSFGMHVRRKHGIPSSERRCCRLPQSKIPADSVADDTCFCAVMIMDLVQRVAVSLLQQCMRWCLLSFDSRTSSVCLSVGLSVA